MQNPKTSPRIEVYLPRVSEIQKQMKGISFKGVTDTLESVFGTKPLPPTEMSKKLWAFIKKRKLQT